MPLLLFKGFLTPILMFLCVFPPSLSDSNPLNFRTKLAYITPLHTPKIMGVLLKRVCHRSSNFPQDREQYIKEFNIINKPVWDKIFDKAGK